jgi:hypothetical protein
MSRLNPQYVEHWRGMTGRAVRLLIGVVQLFVCSECAALVVDKEKHTTWHQWGRGHV